MATLKSSNKRTGITDKIGMSASARNGSDLWSEFNISLTEYDEKRDRNIYHKLTIDRDEAIRLVSRLGAWLAESGMSK